MDIARPYHHYIILAVLSVGAVVVVIAAWFTILFTGRYPAGMFDIVEGVMRWHNRVIGYAAMLVTDRYPPSVCPRKAWCKPG